MVTRLLRTAATVLGFVLCTYPLATFANGLLSDTQLLFHIRPFLIRDHLQLLAIQPMIYGQFRHRFLRDGGSPLINPKAPIYVVKSRLLQPYDTRFMTFGPGCVAFTAYDAQSGEEYDILLTGSPKYPHTHGLSLHDQ